jgi:hypothetical protein
MATRPIVATAILELRDTTKQIQVRILIPEWDKARAAWGCRFEIDAPISIEQTVYGQNGVQALTLALKVMSSISYGSTEYREGRLGAFGEFGGYLGFPAPNESLGRAPYPF